MANIEKNYRSEFKKLNILMYIVMGLLLVLIIICLVTSCSSDSDIDYDVSMMREVSVEDVLDMFLDGNTYVLYIGRDTCSVCYDLLPALQSAQLNNNYITQYLDISAVDRTLSNWEELVELLDVETTTTLSEDDSTEEVTDTFGYFLNAKGFTPCVIIIRDGEMVAGFFGTKTETALEDWLDAYGI